MNLIEILNKQELTKEEAIFLLELKDINALAQLYQAADTVRKKYCGESVHIRGVIDFSNHCEHDCIYCGRRRSSFSVERYRMSPEEIISTVKNISNIGVRSIILQSGDDRYYDVDMIAYIIYSIKQEADVDIILNVGERHFDEYRKWKYSGADSCFLKLEASNSYLGSNSNRQKALQERSDHLIFMKSIGYRIAAGNLIGLPNQTLENIAEDIFLCKELDIEMASFAPYIPDESTPYRNKCEVDFDMNLKVLAVARLVLKDVNLPAALSVVSIDEHGRERALQTGANVVMPNFTPFPYREKYANRLSKKCLNVDPMTCRSCVQTLIQSLGRTVDAGKGKPRNLNAASSSTF